MEVVLTRRYIYSVILYIAYNILLNRLASFDCITHYIDGKNNDVVTSVNLQTPWTLTFSSSTKSTFLHTFTGHPPRNSWKFRHKMENRKKEMH